MGTMVGAKQLSGFEFDQAYPYAGCRICGRIFQPTICRNDDVPMQRRIAIVRRWRLHHASKHTEREHIELALSRLWATPEAQLRLAPFGIADMTDRGESLNAVSDQALLEAPRAPIDDADGLSRNEGWLVNQ